MSYERILDTIDLYVVRVTDLSGSVRRFCVEIHTPPPTKTATLFFIYHGVTEITVNYPLSLPHPEKMREEFTKFVSEYILRETVRVLKEVFPASDVFFVHDGSVPHIYPSPSQLSPYTIKSLPLDTPALLFRTKRGSAMRLVGGNESFYISFCPCILYKTNFEGKTPLTFLHDISGKIIPKMGEIFTSLNSKEILEGTLDLPSEVEFLKVETLIQGKRRNQPTYYGYLFLRGRHVGTTSFSSFTFEITPPHLWEEKIIPFLEKARNDLLTLVDRLLFVCSLLVVPPPMDSTAEEKRLSHLQCLDLLNSLKEELSTATST